MIDWRSLLGLVPDTAIHPSKAAHLDRASGGSQSRATTTPPSVSRPSAPIPLPPFGDQKSPEHKASAATPPVGKSLPRAGVRRHDNIRAITIGLDFGTHSTKIVLRPRGAEKGSVLQICEPQEGYPAFACPSLVKVADQRVYFGPRAISNPGGQLYRSLKVQLLPPLGDDQANHVFPRGLTPDLLVAWYLSWVLGRINSAIEKFFPGSTPKLSLNMAAPMDHIEDEALKTRYLGIVQAAWESVFGTAPMPVQQGMGVQELRSRFLPWLEKEVPGREMRPFEVLPETVAPIVSLSRDPRMAPGMYMIVDMGAGTTEMSINYVQEPGADQRIVCYQDRSERLGGDHFQRLTCKHATNDAIKQGTAELVARFMKVFRKAWGEGYQKDSRNSAARKKWRRFGVVLAGGGARHPAIQKAIDSALPLDQWPVGEDHYQPTWHEPTDILLRALDNGESTALLAVANGLSMPRQQWPEFFVPGQVEGHKPPEVVEPLPAYWYVD